MEQKAWIILLIVALIILLPPIFRFITDVLVPGGRFVGKGIGYARRGFGGVRNWFGSRPQTVKRISSVVLLLLALFMGGYLIYTGSRLFETYAAQYLPEVIPTETKSYLSRPL